MENCFLGRAPEANRALELRRTYYVNILHLTSMLRSLALRGLHTLRVRTRAFGPRVGGKLPRIDQIKRVIEIEPLDKL